jgi:hypothetical protein
LIEVIEYNLKPPTNQMIQANDEISYTFSVWNNVTNAYQSTEQIFYGKDPNGLQWNPFDQYISEDEDSRELNHQLKYKLLMFAFLPENDSDVDSRKENLDRFL